MNLAAPEGGGSPYISVKRLKGYGRSGPLVPAGKPEGPDPDREDQKQDQGQHMVHQHVATFPVGTMGLDGAGPQEEGGDAQPGAGPTRMEGGVARGDPAQQRPGRGRHKQDGAETKPAGGLVMVQDRP